MSDKLISFAIGERWSGPLFKCPNCTDGMMHEDKLHTEIYGAQNRYYRCDKCGLETTERPELNG